MDQFEVQVYQASLIVEDKPLKLTKAIAKQFPIMPYSFRFDRLVESVQDGPGYLEPAYVKVNATAIGMDQKCGWMLLVDHPDGGLAWAYPISPDSYLAEKGWPHDKLDEIPTVIL